MASTSGDFTKDPDAILDYHFDWTDWMPNGDSIFTSIFIIPAGLSIGNGTNGAPLPSNTNTNTTYWLIGGTAGRLYEVTNRITTIQGRTDDRTVTIRVDDR